MKPQKHPFQRTIPRARSMELPRPRIMTVLSEIPDFAVTVVKAGAGYGKTTAVGSYVRQSGLQTRWLTIREGDRLGVEFVDRLTRACVSTNATQAEYDRLLEAANSPLTWIASATWASELVDLYVHDELIVILDDFHLVDEETALLQWLDHWLVRLPPNIHVVIVSRTNPALKYVETLALHGEVLWIRERELAFTEEEIGFLFRNGAVSIETDVPMLDRNQVRWLLQKTAGMAMVLSMLMRDWKSHYSFARIQYTLDQQTSIQDQIGRLFMDDLTEKQRNFLRMASLFSPLEGELCDAVLARSDSGRRLLELERKGYIALAEESGGYELHPLVREHLAASLTTHERNQMVQKAMDWYLHKNDESRAIHYLFQFENETYIAEQLVAYIPSYLERGRVSTVQSWLDRLSDQTIDGSPELLFATGEVARHVNQFSEAIDHYDKAYELAIRQENQALLAQIEIGRARLYLDTIQPSRAVRYIRAARNHIAHSDRALRLHILQLAFENSINHGRIVRANRLWRILKTLDGGRLPNNNSDARLLLRMGRIQQVIDTLQPRLIDGTNDNRSALSHREATLLLSLMYVMKGLGKQAKEHAEQGYLVGHYLHAPFVSAVGYIRLGHAQHLIDPLGEDALRSYQEAAGRMDELKMPRGKSEALLGLCLAHGFRGQYTLAKRYGEDGIKIAETAGDVWMASLVRLIYGQVASVNDMNEIAKGAFTSCIRDFGRCGDPFLQTASRLWLALTLFRMGDLQCHVVLDRVLMDAERHDCEFLLERATFCGLRDIQSLVPLLHAHRTQGHHSRRALHVLHQLDGEELDYHPGFTLRVQTFGEFRVWRGVHEISRRDWHREKARALFQFLLAHRGELLHREEICERLWGETEPESAERDFKVALNALSAVLEPSKPGRGPSVFIVRQGSLYGLTSHNMVQVDRDAFLKLLKAAENEKDDAKRSRLLVAATEQYRGDFLPEVRYQSWCDHERDRLKMAYVRVQMMYARMSYDELRYKDVIAACDRVTHYEPTWEDAYVLLMKAHGALFNRAMVVQTYRMCERVLQAELSIAPMESTREIYRQLLH